MVKKLWYRGKEFLFVIVVIKYNSYHQLPIPFLFFFLFDLFSVKSLGSAEKWGWLGNCKPIMNLSFTFISALDMFKKKIVDRMIKGMQYTLPNFTKVGSWGYEKKKKHTYSKCQNRRQQHGNCDKSKIGPEATEYWSTLHWHVETDDNLHNQTLELTTSPAELDLKPLEVGLIFDNLHEPLENTRYKW